MPFGLCNAPGTFQRAMALVMRSLQWRTVLIYLDDLIIVSRTFDEHLHRLGGPPEVEGAWPEAQTNKGAISLPVRSSSWAI